MMSHYETDDRVLEVIVRTQGRTLDDIVLECPELTWNQVFVVIDRLSREGALRLMPKGRGCYTVHLASDVFHDARQHARV